ncbi:MAG: DNA mismatch repair endonuclease MutL, partial [Methanomicrobium sp.]|nr:DNA mismatch repair endonuclease MutL [Methanomicrobium sp.]
SLDSGAESISVDIGSDSAGIFRIRVIDDGCGMDRDSAQMSILRHATSKITNASDLFSIHTLGFRGEALASIAGVSKFTLITKEKNAGFGRGGFGRGNNGDDGNAGGIVAGTKIVVQGGDILEVSDIGAPAGTTVFVENLFFNTPARKKFLKSRQTEFSHIYSVVENAALANPDISFSLTHNGKEKLSTIKTDSLLETASYIYGRGITDDMCRVKSAGVFIKIDGLCSIQTVNYPISKQIIISINKRPVTSQAIVRAVKRGYGTLLPKDRYPVAFLNITIDSGIVDVNVHPAKREVRLSREKEISEEIVSAIREALESGNIHAETAPACSGTAQTSLFSSGTGSADATSQANTDTYPNTNPNTNLNTYSDTNANANPNPYRAAFTNTPETSGRLFCNDSGTESADTGGAAGSLSDMESSVKALFSSEGLRTDEGAAGYHPQFSTTDSQLRLTENFDYSDSDKIMLPPMEVVGQYDDAYIIARMKNQDGDELVIVDQHAAHERILYDKVSKIRNSKKNSQELLVPSVITLKPKEAEVLMANRAFLEEEGFVIEEFGKNTFAVRSVPLVLGKRIGTEILSDILTDLMDDSRKTIEEKKEKITSTIACRAAIKAGAVLTREQMERLLNQLARTDLPYTCPHGRPTMILFSRSKLDSLFLRS